MALPETLEPEDHLGMTDAQWVQWQAYTHGFGEQDANGVDVSCLRSNLLLTPAQRLKRHQQALRLTTEVRNAGVKAGLSRYFTNTKRK